MIRSVYKITRGTMSCLKSPLSTELYGIMSQCPLPNYESPAATIVSKEDYPKLFRGLLPGTRPFAHPNDYEIDNKPVKPEIFLYRTGIRSRLFLRASIKIDENLFTSATFLLDSGYCLHLSICEDLKKLIKTRIQKSEIGHSYISTNAFFIRNGGEEQEEGGVEEDKKADCCMVKYGDFEHIKQPVNVMGLPMLFLLGMQFVSQPVHTFQFDDNQEEGIARHVVTFNNFPYI